MKIDEFLTQEEKKAIEDIIKNIEKRTLSKIRIFITSKSGKNPEEKARELFLKLNLRNEKKNNILLLISIKDRKFTIFFDDAIGEKINNELVENIKNAAIEKFKNKEYAIGIIGVINSIAEKTIEFFPKDKESENKEQIIFYG